MSNLDDFLGGGNSGGGGGVPLGGLIETQANVPDLTGYRRINNRVQLTRADHTELFDEVGSVADNAPFVNASAPINNSAVFHEPAALAGIGGTPAAFKKVAPDLWMLRNNAQLWYSTAGVDGPYTQSASFPAINHQSNVHNWGFDYANGYAVFGKSNSNEIVVNAVADDFEGAWSTIAISNWGSNGRVWSVQVLNGFWIVLCTSGYWTNNGRLYTFTCPITANPAISGNWTLSSDLWWDNSGNISWDMAKVGRVSYDPVGDKFVIFTGMWNTIDDTQMRWLFTAPGNDPSSWTENADFDTQYGLEYNNARFDPSIAFTTPDGIRWLFATEASNYVYAYRFDNGYDAAPTDKMYVRNPAVSNGNGANGPPPSYSFYPTIPSIPLIHDGWSFLTWYTDTIYKIEWNGAEWNFYPSNSDFKIIYGVSEFNDNNAVRGMRYYDPEEERFTCVGKFNPAASSDVIIWDYPFFTYDKATEFVLLPVTHANSLMVYQARVE